VIALESPGQELASQMSPIGADCARVSRNDRCDCCPEAGLTFGPGETMPARIMAFAEVAAIGLSSGH